MTPAPYTEDTLVQQTTAEYLEQELSWESVYAYNNEDFGPDSLLGRESDREVVLTRTLLAKIEELNPGLPATAYEDAIRQIVTVSASQTMAATNREKYELIKGGVQVTFRNAKGERVRQRLRVFDFDVPENNHFLCVRELWVRGDLYRRRADIVGFVNGLPLLFMELKNVSKDIRAAYEQNFLDYKDTVPHLFHHNAMVVLANGVDAKLGSLTSRFEHFHEWKRLAENQPGVVAMETLLKGVCAKANFLDLVENFIVFDDSAGNPRKILARNHQFLGVNRAIAAVRDRKLRNGKLGVFWHTQGSGKSYSMVLFTRKVHRKLGGNFTFLILTDRDDLDTQIYKTFAGCGVVDNDRDPCRAASGEHLAQLLAQHKSHVFSLIQKFNQTVVEGEAYSRRDDLIVITDESHRTQYGTLALNMRNALPNASYIGFTGTPLFKDDEITRRVFGDYVSTYDFQRAVEDKATDEQDEQYLRRQIKWMRQTQMAVVVSEEQGEVEKFRKWELDITPHRRLIKEGIDLPEAMRKQLVGATGGSPLPFQNMQRMPLDDAFKAEEHPFRVAIVCAMWLTGFDVPSLSTLYLDKPLKAHTLMQAIARANRVNEGKNNGMIVDYCGILKNLRKALATFAGTSDDGRGGDGGETAPAKPYEELLDDLREAIALPDVQQHQTHQGRGRRSAGNAQGGKTADQSLARQGIHPERGPFDNSGLSLERANRVAGNLLRGRCAE